MPLEVLLVVISLGSGHRLISIDRYLLARTALQSQIGIF